MGIFRSSDFWPPNSPDLNPLDYYICIVVRKDTNKSRYPNIESLQKAIQAIFMKLQGVELKRACQRFHPRLEAVIHNRRGYGGVEVI
jgi:transposase